VNLQNFPRGDKVVKRAIVPRLGVLSFFDYSAIEPRLFAYYAAKMGFPEMAKMVRDGIDPYTAVAALIEQKESITPEERQHWKVFFLSLMYGGGLRTIMAQFDCNTKQARSMVNQFHENFPAVRSIQDTVARVSAQRGYILGIDGRHLHPEPHGEHKMLNKLIQGGAAGIMKQATLLVHRELQRGGLWGLTSRIISIVHDELQIDGPERDVEWLHKNVPALMVHAEVNEVVPIEVDHEVSTTNWAEKIPYDEWR
jgi:DNA polymerase I-like protein with 3'-5' exonuclease and polymerase domains